MPLDANKLQGLLFKKQDNSSLARILLEYATLVQKVEAPSGQSWYFKKGLEANKKRILDLTKEFNDIKDMFNDATIDALLGKINENSEGKRHYEKYGMNTIQQMHYSKMNSENEFLRELIRLKSKTKSLRDIDYYLKHPEEFLNILN
jgi:hypothetical protein